jgi:ABC-type Fe3+/spermidine/putrescine transport system ATPase subunit
MRAGAVPGIQPGTAASLVLRAEAISLEPGDGEPRRAGDGTPSLRGRVADVRFVGAMVHYRIDVAGVRLHVIESSEGSLLAEGSDVDVSWRMDDALVLVEGTETASPSIDENAGSEGRKT